MKKQLVGATCAALAGLAGAGPAAAQDGTCRASAVRATTAAGTNTEPVRANAAGSPCSSQSSHTVARTSLGPVSADAVGAFTDRAGAAFASASHVAVGTVQLSATAVEATATAPCGGSATGTSRVVGLTIQGQSIVLPPGDATHTIPLGSGSSVVLNEEVRDGAALIRRAIRVTTPAGEVVLAEAIAAPAKCPSSPPPPVCPAGSTYDPGNNVCIVTQTSTTTGPGGGGGGGGGTNSNTSTDVARPFEGPQGGTVVTIEEARRIAPRSPCVKGKGPRYAIVGTKGRDRITGTNRSERILLLAGRDHSEGGRGHDCMDGGKGVDTLSGAIGKDRLFGRSGNDHLIGGSHADRLHAGPGHDTVSTGFGKDRIYAGSGRDRINAATAGPAARRIKCGKGRDKIRVNRNEKRRARRGSCERIYVIR